MPQGFPGAGLAHSFRCAFRGLAHVLRTQRNAGIHAGATVAVVAAGFVLGVSPPEWCLLVLAMAAVWSLEALNTAVETLGDALSPGPHPRVGQAKDAAAGAVLVGAVGAAIIGALVFVPRLFRLFGPGLLAMTVLLGGSTASEAAGGQPRHLIYLHGRIVQAQQDARPRHPRFGHYELRQIEEAFRDRGFVVHAEIRPESASVSDSADRVVEQVRRLLGSGVPAHRVSVVGASMGGAIALLASARLQEKEIRFSVLGTCLDASVRRLRADTGRGPIGHVLSIREASDDLVGDCPTWRAEDEPSSGLQAREIVLDTGLSHGFLYRPLPEWLEPVVDWAGAAGQDGSGHDR